MKFYLDAAEADLGRTGVGKTVVRRARRRESVGDKQSRRFR